MAASLPHTIVNGTPGDATAVQQNFEALLSFLNTETVHRDGSVAMTQPLTLPGAPTQPNHAATKAYVDTAAPIGAIWMFAGTSAPTGWLLCNGQAVSRATYSALFSVIGTRYGAGDGSTTFNLPDFRGRGPMGHNSGGAYAATLGQRFGSKDAIVVSHSHTVNSHTHSINHDHPSATTSASGGHNHGISGMLLREDSNGSPIDRHDGGVALWTASRWEFSAAGNHTHTFNVPAFSGTSGASAPGTSTAGSSGTNANIHPVQVVNFIIKY